jgi:predicted ester cyclase
MKETKEKNEFTGAVDVYRSYFGCINTMIQKFGAKQVLDAMSESDNQRGIKVGQEIRASAGGEDFDIPKALYTIIDMASDIGGEDTILDVSATHGATVTKFGKCPVYEGAKSLGMDDKEIEELCRASSLVFLNTVVKQLNPKLKYIVSAFRSEEYGGCVEEIVVDDKA